MATSKGKPANRKPNTPITKRERDVIASRYMGGVGINKIADELGRSRQGIYNIISEFPESFTKARDDILSQKHKPTLRSGRQTREDYDMPTVSDVKKLLDAGFTQKGISDNLGIPIYYINEIIRENLPEYVRQRISSDGRVKRDQDIRNDYYNKGMTISELAQKYDRKEFTILNAIYSKKAKRAKT